MFFLKKALLATLASILLAVPAAHARGPVEGGLQRFSASDGAAIVYRISGRGQPCIFIHGGPGQGSESFRQMGGEALEDFARILYLDQRGSGHSPDAADYGLTRIVDDIEEARRHAGLASVCLIAHSFGGIIAVNYARRYPSHVSSIILANATLHFLSRDTLRMQIGMLAGLVDPPMAAPPREASIEALYEARAEVRAQVDKTGRAYLQFTDDLSTLRRMIEIDRGYRRSHGFGDAVMLRPAPYPEYFLDYAPSTAEIDAPVLVIAGAKDYVVGARHHESFRFRRSTTVVLDCGHMPYADAPAGFVAAIRGFLE